MSEAEFSVHDTGEPHLATAPVAPAMEPAYDAEQLMRMAAAVEAIGVRNVSRRAVLGFGKLALQFVAASTVLHYAEQPLMNHLYGDHDTELVYSGKIKHSVKNAALVSQGWGLTQSQSIVNALLKQEVYEDNFPFGAFRCSNKGVSRAAFARCGQNFSDVLGPQETDVHAVSEGLMISLTAARASKRHVRMISSYDSPNDINDAYHSALAEAVALANHAGIYHGGVLGKLATALTEEIDQHGPHELFTGWVQAVKSTVTGGDPRMMVSQLTFLHDTNLRREWKSFRGIIDKDTTAVVLRTKKADTDRVVKDIQAGDKLCDMYGDLGATVIQLEVDTPGHADTDAGIAMAAPHYKHILAAA